MKKSKLLVIALIGLMLAGGLALASCRANCVGDGNCTYDNNNNKGTLCTDVSCAALKAVSNRSSGTCDC